MKVEYEETEFSKRFSDFISEERRRFLGDADNRAAFSLAQVARYVRFLGLVHSRYTRISKIVSARFEKISEQMLANRDMTAEEQADVLDGWKYDALVHLEIESFYLFANILLSKIAQCIEDYFGPARGLTLKSHSNLCKFIEAYAKDKELNLPESWIKSADDLKCAVTDYRDKNIAHFKNPRALHGTTFTKDGVTGMTTIMLYPKETDATSTSRNIDDLYKDISGYCDKFRELIHENQRKSRYVSDAA